MRYTAPYLRHAVLHDITKSSIGLFSNKQVYNFAIPYTHVLLLFQNVTKQSKSGITIWQLWQNLT